MSATTPAWLSVGLTALLVAYMLISDVRAGRASRRAATRTPEQDAAYREALVELDRSDPAFATFLRRHYAPQD